MLEILRFISLPSTLWIISINFNKSPLSHSVQVTAMQGGPKGKLAPVIEIPKDAPGILELLWTMVSSLKIQTVFKENFFFWWKDWLYCWLLLWQKKLIMLFELNKGRGRRRVISLSEEGRFNNGKNSASWYLDDPLHSCWQKLPLNFQVDVLVI